MKINGQTTQPKNPQNAITAGMALVPEDRKLHGLVLPLSVRENTSLASLKRDQKKGFLNFEAEEEVAEEAVTQLQIKTPHLDQLTRFLSGGNQQKIVLGKWLALKPHLLMLDEPTRGIDVGAKREIYRLMEKLAGEGMAILFVSSEMEEILGMADRALVMASDTNPREMHLWTASLADDDMARITTARGWHQCSPSSNGELVLDRHSNLEHPGTLAVVSTRDGSSWTLAEATDPSAGYQLGDSEFFVVEAADGTPLHGLLLTPPGAAAAEERQYPALQYVYGGPHSQLVRDTWLGGANPWLHYLCSRGFVVLVLDNRGTDNRGIDFSQAIFRRFSALEVEDQVRGLDEVTSLPFVDPDRVGVHGWSFGGYMTLSLMLAHPDRYACGISGAPVTDWAQYETGYTERYMDTPAQNPDGYRSSSVLPRADQLDGRLLLVHGTDDKTVMFSHSMRFLRACIDAGELIDFMAYPMQKHGLRGRDRTHLYRTMTRFLTERLRP